MTAGGLIAPGELHSVVLAQLQRIGPSAGSHQAARYADALDRGDGRAVTDLLIRDFSVAGSAYRLLAVYARIVLALERSAALGRAFAGRGLLHRTIRQQIRCELLGLAPDGAILWLIPATPDDQVAAHVAALIFARSGATVRPWLWPGPPHGTFRIVAAAGRGLRVRAGHGCLGVSDFAHLVLPALRSLPPVAALRA